MRDCRKTYIACAHTHSHGTEREDGEHASNVLRRRAPKAEENEGRSHLGRVLSPVSRNDGRISRISRSPLTKASGAKDVLHMITLLDGIKALSEAI